MASGPSVELALSGRWTLFASRALGALLAVGSFALGLYLGDTATVWGFSVLGLIVGVGLVGNAIVILVRSRTTPVLLVKDGYVSLLRARYMGPPGVPLDAVQLVETKRLPGQIRLLTHDRKQGLAIPWWGLKVPEELADLHTAAEWFASLAKAEYERPGSETPSKRRSGSQS